MRSILPSFLDLFTDTKIRNMAIMFRIQQQFTFIMQWSCFGKRMAYQNICNILKVKNTYIQLLHNSSSIQICVLKSSVIFYAFHTQINNKRGAAFVYILLKY